MLSDIKNLLINDRDLANLIGISSLDLPSLRQSDVPLDSRINSAFRFKRWAIISFILLMMDLTVLAKAMKLISISF